MPLPRLDNVISVGLAATLAYTSLSRGAVEPWFLGAFELTITALAALLAFRAHGDAAFRLRIPPPVWPLIVLLAVGLVQSLALTDPAGIRRSLSLDPEATRSTVIALAALIAATLIAANVLTNRTQLGRAAYFLTFYGLAMAVFGFGHYFVQAVYGDSQGWAVQGMYVNHNHFAGHIELLLPFPVALVITNAAPGKRALFIFAAVIIGMAVVASLSRGGMLSVAAEMLLMLAVSLKVRLQPHEEDEWITQGQQESLLALMLRKVGWRRDDPDHPRHSAPLTAAVIALLAVGVVVGALWFNEEAVVSRVTNGKFSSRSTDAQTFESSRGWLWGDTFKMFQANAVGGVGFGAYETAYPIYAGKDWAFFVDKAHNDYLQILADTGVIGGALAVIFIVLALRGIARSLRTKDPLLAAVALASGAGIVGMLVHSFFDFNLQLTSNSYLFLLLIAVNAGACLKPRLRNGESVAFG